MTSYVRIAMFAAFLLTGCFGGKDNPSDDKNTPTDSATSTLPDRDGDGYSTDQDCDDGDASIYDGAPELCDGKDNDCNGLTDDGADDGIDYYTDGDDDGWGAGDAVHACAPPEGTVDRNGDCADADGAVHPEATEICNEIDDDCDGSTDEGVDDGIDYYQDRDGDGYGAGSAQHGCSQPANTVTNADDCDDMDRLVNPDGIEVCNGVDDDCDGSTDEDATDMDAWYPDTDRDTHGDETVDPTWACTQPVGYVASHDDCDDGNRAINPDAAEVCDGLDNDCDGSIDEGATDAYVLYPDTDGDGYGDDGSAPILSCSPVSGYTTSNNDCDDGNAAINPGAVEVCDGVDNDCNGTVDGSDATDAVTVWPDADRDGYGDDGARSVVTCTLGAGFVTNNGDCDDTDAAVNPGEDEYCDFVDNDCDGLVDEDDALDATFRYEDADNDGFGDPASGDLRCDGVDNSLDCDDTDRTEPQVVDAASTATRPDGSVRLPWPAIQQGIDAADQCVLVFAGTYTENLDFSGKDILVWSRDGADETYVDGSGGGPVVKFNSGETAGAELRGFTLMNGTGYQEETSSSYSCGSSSTCTDHYISVCGGGVYVDGAEPTLGDLTVLANSVTVPVDYTAGTDFYYFYSFGGGLCLRNATVSMEGVDLWENYAEDGGGAYVESTAELDFAQGSVQANNADFGGGFEVDGGSLTLHNTLIAWNVAADSAGGVFGVDATVSSVNVTIGECEAVTAGGIYASGTTAYTSLNSIVYGADSGVGVLVDATASYSSSYSDVYGNTDGNYSGISDPTGTSGNISANPAFVSVTADGDYSNDNWTFPSSSGAHNTGHPAAVYNDADGSRNDMGAYGGPGGGW